MSATVAQMAACDSGGLEDVKEMRWSTTGAAGPSCRLSDCPVYCAPSPKCAFMLPQLAVLGRPFAVWKGATTTLELGRARFGGAKVAFVPGEAFGAPGADGFSYALADDDLAEGRPTGKLFG